MPLTYCRLGFAGISGIETVDRLLHQGLAQPNAPVDLLGQNLEAFVAEENGLALPRLRNWWQYREMIPRVQRDSFSHHSHVAFKAVEPDAHIVETLSYDIFRRWGCAQKVIEGSFHNHALTDARSFRCSTKPIVEVLGKPHSHLAAPQSFTLGNRWRFRFDVPDQHFEFALELHDHSSPSPRASGSRYPTR